MFIYFQNQHKICSICTSLLNQVDELQLVLKSTVEQLDSIEQRIYQQFLDTEKNIKEDACMVVISTSSPHPPPTSDTETGNSLDASIYDREIIDDTEEEQKFTEIKCVTINYLFK